MPVKTLANNLKFLRNEFNLSQERLAEEIGVKRSSIAAYECKGVEPRLLVLVKMAKFFDIDLTELIEHKLSSESPEYSSFVKGNNIQVNVSTHNQSHNKDNQLYCEHIQRINKIVEGFKTYIEYKLQQEELNKSTIKLRDDVRHFISILEQILESNESFQDNNFTNEA